MAGDKVAIISPSGAVDPAYVEGAVKAIKAWGFEPVLGKYVLAENREFGAITMGGTDEQRFEDLKWAIDDPEIKAILCSRGGYGAMRLLERLFLPPENIHIGNFYEKWLIGFSDISALNAHWLKSGMLSIHASMAKQLAENGVKGIESETLHNILTGVMPDYDFDSHPLSKPGSATGTLVGGNLAVLAALIGTPYNMFDKGDILFLEDVGEEIYRVERIMLQLRSAGVFRRLKGLIIGQFSRYHIDGQLTDSNSDPNMYEMIARILKPYDIPTAFGFPIGHEGLNVPLIEGATVTLSINQFHKGTTTLHTHQFKGELPY